MVLDEGDYGKHIVRPLCQERIVIAIRVAGKLAGVLHRPVFLRGLTLRQKLALIEKLDAKDGNSGVQEPLYLGHGGTIVGEKSRFPLLRKPDDRPAVPIRRLQQDHRQLGSCLFISQQAHVSREASDVVLSLFVELKIALV